MFLEILLVIFLVLIYLHHFGTKSIFVNGEEFKTINKYDDKKEAALLMYEINKRVLTLLRYLLKKGEGDNPIIRRILDSYNWQNMEENSPDNISDTTSYMENKGEKFVVCLRDKDGKLHDINTLMFVVCHEISHLSTIEFGHTPNFWKNFKTILEAAVECKVYEAVDYSKNPLLYCGRVSISTNPLFDDI